MKLVIVDRARSMTYERMRYLFAGDPTVAVIWDRRNPDERRQRPGQHAPDRRVRERRQKLTEFGGRGFIVVDVDAADVAIPDRTGDTRARDRA
jgi:hypothetical protein